MGLFDLNTVTSHMSVNSLSCETFLLALDKKTLKNQTKKAPKQSPFLIEDSHKIKEGLPEALGKTKQTLQPTQLLWLKVQCLGRWFCRLEMCPPNLQTWARPGLQDKASIGVKLVYPVGCGACWRCKSLSQGPPGELKCSFCMVFFQWVCEIKEILLWGKVNQLYGDLVKEASWQKV